MPQYELLQDRGMSRGIVLVHQDPATHPGSSYPQSWIDRDRDTHDDDEWQERERKRTRRRRKDRDTERDVHGNGDGFSG